MIHLEQKLCFQRWVRQEVWRTVEPSIGPHAHKVVAIKRGIIRRIYEQAPYYTFQRGLQLHEVEWYSDLNLYTLERCAGRVDGGTFDFGLGTAFELSILVRGGLLQSNTAGVFNEKQPDGLPIDLYKAALERPHAALIMRNER